MTATMSVLDKALALQTEASRLREGADADADAVRVSHRVDETLSLLRDLRQTVTTVRRFQATGTAPTIDLSNADDGRVRFARHAAGLPSNHVFTTAQQKIKDATGRIARALTTAWSAWASERLASLPLVRITMLPADAQEAERKRKDELQRLARKPPSPGDIDLFLTSIDLLEESLAGIPDPHPEILELIKRLAERPGLTLHEVTDDQIALLRTAQIADQVELRRRGA